NRYRDVEGRSDDRVDDAIPVARPDFSISQDVLIGAQSKALRHKPHLTRGDGQWIAHRCRNREEERKDDHDQPDQEQSIIHEIEEPDHAPRSHRASPPYQRLVSLTRRATVFATISSAKFTTELKRPMAVA